MFGATKPDGTRSLWMRTVDSVNTLPIPGTETRSSVGLGAWSPDGRPIAYVSDNKPCAQTIAYFSRAKQIAGRTDRRKFGGGDGLANVSLGVLGDVGQQADHRRGEVLAAYGAGFGEYDR